MPNMGTIIKRHNARVCGPGHESDYQFSHSNCRDPDHCPLNEECLASIIVYKAIVNTSSTTAPKICIGSTETPFKRQLANHLTSVKTEKYENRTELSKYIWKLKSEGETFRIDCMEYTQKSLSVLEFVQTMQPAVSDGKGDDFSADSSTLQNMRSELVSKYCHQTDSSYQASQVINPRAHGARTLSLARAYLVFAQGLYLKA